MSLFITDSTKFAITRTGLHIRDELFFGEWRDLAPKFSEAINCAAFLIGNWLVYVCPVSTRRLRKSIIAGRLLTPEELHSDPTDRGIENHIPYVNRLVALWARIKERRWLQRSTHEQRAAFERDLHPVVEIYNQL